MSWFVATCWCGLPWFGHLVRKSFKHLLKLFENQKLQMIPVDEPFALIYKQAPSYSKSYTQETKTCHFFSNE